MRKSLRIVSKKVVILHLDMKFDDIKYHLILGALETAARLPLRALYVISDMLSFIAHRVIRYRVKVVRKNLRNSFPEKDEAELKKIESRFYRYLCDNIVETVKLLHIGTPEIEKRIKMRNAHIVSDVFAEKKPVILYLGHLANWEWVPALTLMFEEKVPMGALYKPLRNKVMDRVMKRIRSRFPVTLIPAKTAFRKLIELRRNHPSFIIGFIADQRPLGAASKHWTWFMNQKTSFMTGGETIGEKVGAKFVYVETIRKKRGYITLNYKSMEISPDDREDYPYTRLYFRMLEESIRKEPAYWLWSHNRWKKQQQLDDHSSASNESNNSI